MKIVISSGHGLKIRGAAGPSPWGLDEVNEARKVVEQVAKVLRGMGITVTTFHDDISDDQDENLNRIVNFHNAQGAHDLDISVHFNSATFNGSNSTNDPVGTEVFYQSSAGKEYATKTVNAIAAASGLKNRGAKTGNLFFLSHTNQIANLQEICFVNSRADVDIYHAKFSAICSAISESLAGKGAVPIPPSKPEVAFHAVGKCSYFGGPGDTTGMTADEPLAFLYKQGDKPEVFLAGKSLDTQALGRDLNPHTHYLACRWDYDVTPKTMLAGKQVALVRAIDTEIALTAMPSDWGPNSNTGRVADLSPSLMADLQIATDDEVEITYPYDPPKVA